MTWMESLTIDPPSKTVRARLRDGLLALPGSQRPIEWVAQLKPLHAQRIAHEIGQSLSPVGLIEAEWVRLCCEP